MNKSVRFVACLAVIAVSGCSTPEPELIVKPNQPEYVERGMQLVEGLAACGFCHGAKAAPGSPLIGGRAQYDTYGAVPAANLTNSLSGVGAWSTLDIVQALRTSVDKWGNELSPDVHRGYEWLSDDDAIAIVAYIKALPPAGNSVDRRSISMLDRNTTGLLKSHPEVRGYVPSINPKFTLEYGQYLINHVARCQYCHSTPGGFIIGESYLGGGATIRTDKGEKVAPDITSSQVTGIGDWSGEDIVQYLLHGKTPDGNFIDPAFCPVEFYRRAPMSDLLAIAKYLKSVPAAD